MNIRIRLLGFVTVTTVLGLGLSGCAGVVPMKPAEDSNNPECANVTVRLPDTVSDLAKRETNAQATGAWGTPAAVLLTCGVEVPGPTTLPCVSINDVDWIEDDSQAPLYRYTTYGRTPAVEVVIDSEAVSGTTTLVDLGPAVSVLPKTSQCIDITDVFKN
ncbi:DUF3515 domain-containing protein [Aurantimicrobium minutum]|uniref:DUF3515 domain-containing protein n=1 Tax=Aurantimicrobium minutum TaxID=708131 RepID=UPI002476AF86|nr:DUF3515 domain-containing protein [Aurantimicrobium minutum]MDH6239168.1 hypothetical protein [Aurantimicrobium minutum]